jgi:hypothetical protein
MENVSTEKVLDAIRDLSAREYGFVARFARDTKIPDYRVYQWLRGRGEPKVDDMQAIVRWFDKNKVMYTTPTVTDKMVKQSKPSDDLEKRVAQLETQIKLIIELIKKQ